VIKGHIVSFVRRLTKTIVTEHTGFVGLARATDPDNVIFPKGVLTDASGHGGPGPVQIGERLGTAHVGRQDVRIIILIILSNDVDIIIISRSPPPRHEGRQVTTQGTGRHEERLALFQILAGFQHVLQGAVTPVWRDNRQG
jgi:hypothetical protein